MRFNDGDVGESADQSGRYGIYRTHFQWELSMSAAARLDLRLSTKDENGLIAPPHWPDYPSRIRAHGGIARTDRMVRLSPWRRSHCRVERFLAALSNRLRQTRRCDER